MRAPALRAAAVALCLLAVVAASPVEAKPFHETRKVLRGEAHDTLLDADKTSAQLLRDARKLLKLPALPAFPALPSAPAPAPVEVRASMVMPGFQGRDEVLAMTWIAPTAERWTGVYWLESDDGMILPRLLDFGGEGLLLFMYGGSLSLDQEISGARYHFLGADGAYVTYALDTIPLLPGMPTLDRVSLAGADASTEGVGDALLLAPWNTLAENVTMGVTLLAEGVVVDEFVVAGCADPYATATEAGCRLLYVVALPPHVTHLELWRIDASGSRIVDETHDRTALELGVAFAG